MNENDQIFCPSPFVSWIKEAAVTLCHAVNLIKSASNYKACPEHQYTSDHKSSCGWAITKLFMTRVTLISLFLKHLLPHLLKSHLWWEGPINKKESHMCAVWEMRKGGGVLSRWEVHPPAQCFWSPSTLLQTLAWTQLDLWSCRFVSYTGIQVYTLINTNKWCRLLIFSFVFTV